MAMVIEALANKFLGLDSFEPSKILTCVVSPSSLLERIKAPQYDDPHLLVLKDMVQRGGSKKIIIGDDGVMRLKGRLFVCDVDGLSAFIFEEADNSQYSIHPEVTKIIVT